jgi:hypothetical protein
MRDDHNSSMQRLEDEENHAVQPIKIKNDNKTTDIGVSKLRFLHI